MLHINELVRIRLYKHSLIFFFIFYGIDELYLLDWYFMVSTYWSKGFKEVIALLTSFIKFYLTQLIIIFLLGLFYNLLMPLCRHTPQDPGPLGTGARCETDTQSVNQIDKIIHFKIIYYIFYFFSFPMIHDMIFRLLIILCFLVSYCYVYLAKTFFQNNVEIY